MSAGNLLRALLHGGVAFGEAQQEQKKRARAEEGDALQKRIELLKFAALNRDWEERLSPGPRMITVDGAQFADTPEGHAAALRWRKQYATAGRAPQTPPAPRAPVLGTPEYLKAQEELTQMRDRYEDSGTPGNLPAADRRARDVTEALLSDVTDAEAKLEAYPEAIGVKGYLPDAILQRTDPKGVAVRAALANVASQILLARSGGAVSDAEFGRLEPFLPDRNDDVEAARTKLRNIREQLKRKNATMGSGTEAVTPPPTTAAPPALTVPTASAPPPGAAPAPTNETPGQRAARLSRERKKTGG